MERKLSSLIGKQLLTPAGERLGYVLGATLTQNLKNISCLYCADQEDEEFYLPARAILSYGDALIVGKSRLSAPTGVPSPVMTPAYLHTGELAGVVCDYILGDDPRLVLWKDGTQTTVSLSLAARGETLIIYPTEAAKKRAPKSRASSAPAAKKKQPSTPVQTPIPTPVTPPEQLPFAPMQETPEQPAPEVRKPFDETTNAHTEQGIQYSLNRLNLLGRKLKKSVYDSAGQPIAIAGERITPSVISSARRNNRLLELTVNTLTNVL